MDLNEEFERAVEFLAGRDLDRIPKEEIIKFTDGTQLGNIRLAIFFEVNRYRTDEKYVREIKRMYPEGRSFRRFWYDLVKPFLNRVEDPEQVLKPKWGRYRSQALSAVLSNMVLEKFVRYKDINIMDVGEYSRPKERPYRWDKYETGRFDEVIIFVEKVAEFPTIKPLAKLLGFTCECGRGQQATSAIDSLIDYLDPEKSYLVFVLTDFDYWGFLIADSLRERSHQLDINAEFIRVGITPEQVPPDVLEVKKFYLPLSNGREREWAQENAIDGIYGVELEALNPFQLRALIADAVYEYCDLEALYKFLKEKALEDIPGQVAEELADVDLLVSEIRFLIARLMEKFEEIKGSLVEDFEPRLEELLDEKIEEIDDRPDFPEDWLRDRIVSGKTSLRTEKYTDTEGIAEKLKELIMNE